MNGRVIALLVMAIMLVSCAPPAGAASRDIIAPTEPVPGQEENEKAEGEFFLFAQATFEWSGFYCLEVNCPTLLGYPQKGYIYKGEKVGCPWAVNVVTGSTFDIVLNMPKTTTSYAYLFGPCKVQALK